jgi:uncharacterized pyridoxamine 5'-phosphate oxidase family protein
VARCITSFYHVSVSHWCTANIFIVYRQLSLNFKINFETLQKNLKLISMRLEATSQRDHQF